MASRRFRARLEPVSHGGCYVVVPPEVAEAAGVAYKDRVRGTVNGAPYESSLMKYSGVFHLGVHKPALAAAGAKLGDTVALTIERDPRGLEVPDDLAAALAKDRAARAGWEDLAPAHKREHVKHLLDAKRPETRARRLVKTLETLRG